MPSYVINSVFGIDFQKVNVVKSPRIEYTSPKDDMEAELWGRRMIALLARQKWLATREVNK